MSDAEYLFHCYDCEYHTNYKSSLNRHFGTKNHQNKVSGSVGNQTITFFILFLTVYYFLDPLVQCLSQI